MSTARTRTILTEGSKARLLKKLTHLMTLVEEDHERDTIMFYAAEIIPAVISELNNYTPKLKTRKKIG
jgi:copper homeostasis protein CutC